MALNVRSDVGDARRSSSRGVNPAARLNSAPNSIRASIRALEQDDSFDIGRAHVRGEEFLDAAFVRSGADSEVATLEDAGWTRSSRGLQRRGKKVVLVMDETRICRGRNCMDRAALGWSCGSARSGINRAAAQVRKIALSRGASCDTARLPGDDRGTRRAAPRPCRLRSDARALRCRAGESTDGQINRSYLYSYGDHRSKFGRGAHRQATAASDGTGEIAAGIVSNLAEALTTSGTGARKHCAISRNEGSGGAPRIILHSAGRSRSLRDRHWTSCLTSVRYGLES